MLAEGIVKSIKNWWVVLIIGILYVLGGIYFLANPGITFLTLALLFSIIFIVDGITTIFFAFQSRQEMEGWGWNLAAGILYTILGIALLRNQGAAVATLILICGFLIMMRGGLAIAFALEARKMEMPYWGWGLAFGILAIGLGAFVVFNPGFGMAFIVAMVAISFIMTGIALIAISLGLRKVKVKASDAIEAAESKMNALHEKVAAFGQSESEEVKSFMEELKSDLKEAMDEIKGKKNPSTI